jgi:hypothetical protein
VVGGGLAGIAGVGILAGVLARAVDLAPVAAGLVSVAVTFGLSFWATPHLRRRRRPGALDPAGHR